MAKYAHILDSIFHNKMFQISTAVWLWGLGIVSAPTSQPEAWASPYMPEKVFKIAEKVPKIVQKGNNLQPGMDSVISYIVK